EEAVRVRAAGADVLLARIEQEQLVEQINGLVQRVSTDPDARSELDRKLRELAALVDRLEEAIEWPKLVDESKEARDTAVRVVNDWGTDDDKRTLQKLRADFDKAIHEENSDSLRRITNEFYLLYFEVLDRQPSYHVSRFNYLCDQRSQMT